MLRPRFHDTASNERGLALLLGAVERYPHLASMDTIRGGAAMQAEANHCGPNYSVVILRSRIFCFEDVRARDRFQARTGATVTTVEFWKRRILP
jgi:hypothetical protein